MFAVDDLMEYDVGVLSGLTPDEVTARYPDLDMDRAWETGLADVEGVELPEARMARARRVVDHAVGGHDDGDTVLMVTHGGILQHILADAAGHRPAVGHVRPQHGRVRLHHRQGPLGHGRCAGRLVASPHRINRFNDASHLG